MSHTAEQFKSHAQDLRTALERFEEYLSQTEQLRTRTEFDIEEDRFAFQREGTRWGLHAWNPSSKQWVSIEQSSLKQKLTASRNLDLILEFVQAAQGELAEQLKSAAEDVNRFLEGKVIPNRPIPVPARKVSIQQARPKGPKHTNVRVEIVSTGTGFAAATVADFEDMGGRTDVIQLAEGRYPAPEDAIPEAENLAECEGLPFNNWVLSAQVKPEPR